MPLCQETQKAISAAPGIGKKTAEKLIVELRDKVDIEDMLEHASHGNDSDAFVPASDSDMQSEAVQALVALGYGSAESMRAVKKTSPDCAAVEDILKEGFEISFFSLTTKGNTDQSWENES